MLPPKYTKTITVTSQDADVTVTATYAAAGVSGSFSVCLGVEIDEKDTEECF